MATEATHSVLEVHAAGYEAYGATLLAPASARAGSGDALKVRGKNGSGKSTLLRLAAGILQPTTGAILVAGTPPRDRDATFRARVATMVGLPPLAPDLTVWEHVLLVATTWERTGALAESRAAGVLAELEIERLRERFPHELSSGQTQVVGLAMTLARPFDLLLLDEPEQRLDPDRLGTLIETLRARLDQGAAIALATHSSVLARALPGPEVTLVAA